MKVQAWVGSVPLIVLIDSGSTHNFLDLGVLQKIKIHCNSKEIVKVMVINGAEIMSEDNVSELPFSIQGKNFSTELHVINFASCDMVLGIFWL